jgi:hypothetical protein
MTSRQPTTHELYLHAVRDLVIARAADRDAIEVEQAERLGRTFRLPRGRHWQCRATTGRVLYPF